tara:strand:- start:133 stop:5097 length:4965 start_codon:yes stop_codon:yes gene_type:complete
MEKSRKLIGKNFRLIDFNIYDHSEKASANDDESTSSNESRSKKIPISEQQFHIQMFGINESGETASITITDYNPFFYVKVGDNWKDQHAYEFLEHIKQFEEIRRMASAILSIKLIDRKKLYGFTGGKTHKFVMIEFKNIRTMNAVKNLYYSYDSNNNRKFKPLVFNKTTTQLYESSIPPLLRYFHIQEVSPSGWVFVQTNKVITVRNKTTTCKYEYTSLKKYVRANTSKETRVPYKICSFDIEASSSHGDFPVPIKSYKKLATNIVDIFNAQEPMEHKRACVLLEKIIMTAFQYGKFDDVDIVYPINKINKEKVKSAIKKLLTKTIGSIVLEKNSAIIGIEQMFEASKDKDQTQNTISGDNDDNDNDNDFEETTSWKRPSKTCSIESKTTIIDILNSNLFERDRKIDEINKLFMDMSSGFPKLEGDRVTFIGSTFMKYGETTPYLNHCLVLGDCDDISNIEIDTCTTEQELLLKWTKLMEKENPDIIIGYNIFGFDYEFLFRRAQENMCTTEFMKFSRIADECSAKMVFNKETQQKTEDLENTKVVLASGEYDLRYFKMTGRLQIDMYSYFRRDFNLSSYKLDDVAGEFISDDIKKVEYHIDENHTHLYSGNLAGLNIGDYIHIEITQFSSDYYNGGEKFRVLNIIKGVESGGKKFNVIVIKGQHELDMKLKIKWTMAKDDVSPQDIFRLSNGNSSDRAVVAKYCIQDCNLVHHLMNKIDVLTGYIEMSSICSVPISFLVFRGQGIKLTSYVAKKCREKNTLMPDLQKSKDGEGYEGAIVLPPKCSMYMDNPVACVDYSSLYPSSMISQNYSHDSKVWTKEYDLQGNLIKETGEKDPKTGEYLYDNLPGYEYIHIEFDNYKYLRPANNPKAREVKTKVGKIICCWAQLPNGQKSIMPSILEELLSARKATRKKIKSEPDPFMQNILDKRQLGYKVTANSLYGQCGAKTSTFYEKDVAASTTATGRSMIIYAKKIIEEVYGNRLCETKNNGIVLTKAEYVYGDSVASYTPVYIRVDGKIHITEINRLSQFSKTGWVSCIENGKEEKEYCELNNVETWSDNGWTQLKRIIRHQLAPHKKMHRILTHTGVVDVTDDHSLLTIDGNEISPKDVKLGTELLHKTMINDSSIESNDMDVLKAMIYGFFFGDGSCGIYNCPTGKKSTWALNNSNEIVLTKYLELCEKCYPEYKWEIYDTLNSSGVYKLTFHCNEYGEKLHFIQMYRKCLYVDKMKVIPDFIMNGSQDVRAAFWEGVYDADGDKDEKGCMRIDQKSQLSSAQLCWLANSIGYKTSLNIRKDKPDIYRITTTKGYQRKNPNAIKKMVEIDYKGFVYDLTTDNHHFAAGIGNMIVHNTDSVFFTFNLEDPKTKQPIRGQKALEITIEIAQEAAHLSSEFLKPPMDLEYEKTLMPFILLSKKRYVGMLYEDDPNKGKLKYMGLVLKRRDNCDLVKDVYGGVLDILMKDSNIENSIKFLNNYLEDLIQGKIHMDKLAITKALRGYYKNPNQIAHNVLANRMGKRDPGNKPKPGDRIKYLYVNTKDKKALQGDKIENPEYIIENKLQIDYNYYITNQLMKPLQQLFGLALEQIWRKQNKTKNIREYTKEMKVLEESYGDDIETFMKKKEKYCSEKIKKMLFDQFLTKIYNKQNGIQTMDMFTSIRKK